MQMNWIISNKNDPKFCWSNTFGWCSETYDSFTQQEKDTLNLPIDGVWESVSWRIEE